MSLPPLTFVRVLRYYPLQEIKNEYRMPLKGWRSSKSRGNRLTASEVYKQRDDLLTCRNQALFLYIAVCCSSRSQVGQTTNRPGCDG
jgi:hypothetical protein